MLALKATRFLHAQLAQLSFVLSCIMVFGLPWSSALFRVGIWGFLFCFVLSGNWQNKWSAMSKMPLAWLGTALFFLAFLSMTYTVAPFDLAREDIIRYAKLLAIGPLMLAWDTSRKRHLVVIAFCAGIMVLMLPTLLDGLGIAKLTGLHLDSLANQAYTRETFDKGAPNLVYWRNQIVHGLFVAILCFVCLEKSVRYVRYRISLLLLAVLCVVDIVYFIQGRMALLGLVAVLIYFSLIRINTARGKLMVVTILASTVITAYLTVPNISLRINSASREVNAYLVSGNISTSSGIRIHYWTISLDMFRKSMWFGAGAGAFRHTLVSTQDVFADQRHSHTHNEYMTVLSQYGAIGFLFFISLLVTALALIARLEDFEERHCYAAVLLVFALGCLSDSMLYNPHEGWTVVIFLALISAAAKSRCLITEEPFSKTQSVHSPFHANKV